MVCKGINHMTKIGLDIRIGFVNNLKLSKKLHLKISNNKYYRLKNPCEVYGV